MEFSKLKKDKFFLIMLIIIIILGIYVRIIHFSDTGYSGDDMTTIPTGLLWFYPHDYYPGLAGQGEPALGNLIIGSFCMLSGEDFSGVSKTQPMFYPGREELIGEALTNAESYCKSSMYVFGVLFFIIISILSILLLPKYSVLYSISFFAFFPTLLRFSRWIHVDIIAYTFIASGLLFLWLAYKAEKTQKKEIIFFVLSFIFFGLAFATKLPNVIYFLFSIFIIIKKYSKEFLLSIRKILKLTFDINYNEIDKKRFYKIILYSTISFFIAFLAPLNFNPKNLFLIFQKYNSINPERTGISINTNIFQDIFHFLLNINIIDLLILIFSLFILYKLFRIKKKKYEEFILYLTIFFFLVIIFSKAVNYLRIFIMFFYGLIFLMSLAFSKSEYSLYRIFKNKKIIIILVISAILLSSYIAYSTAPYFFVKNKSVCFLNREECTGINPNDFYGYSAKQTSEYLYTILREDETFLPQSIILYYIRRDEGISHYYFVDYFNKKFNRNPTLEEYVKYFHPNNRTVRYYLLDPNRPSEEKELLYGKYDPIHIIKIKNVDTVYIYDLSKLFS